MGIIFKYNTQLLRLKSNYLTKAERQRSLKGKILETCYLIMKLFFYRFLSDKLVVSLTMHQKFGVLIKVTMLKRYILISVSKLWVCKGLHLMLLCMQSKVDYSLLQEGF